MSMGERIANQVNVTFHGVGHGLSGTDWHDCATGIGESYHEAIEDALDSLAQNGWEVKDAVLDLALHAECGRNLERLEADAEEDARELHSECVIDPETNCDDCELHYFVSIDVR